VIVVGTYGKSRMATFRTSALTVPGAIKYPTFTTTTLNSTQDRRLNMFRWIRQHPKLTILTLSLCVPAVYGSITWISGVDRVIDDFPVTRQDVTEVMVDNARLETEVDACQSRIYDLEKHQIELLQAIPRIDANLEWIRQALEEGK